jgi:hypothetical protein
LRLLKNSEANGMLHAFNQGKSNLYRRYLGHRDGSEKRVSEEDEITALIMGPLDYLPPAAAGLFWRGLVEQTGRTASAAFPESPPSHIRMRFWPRRAVEPDLVVELHWPSGERRILLVEFKWNAPLSGEQQLHRQWLEFLTEAERADAYHLFIAPEISAGLNALGSNDVWQGRLILHSWIGVLHVVRNLRAAEFCGLQTWREQMTRFLGKLGILRFQGFVALTTPTPMSAPNEQSSIFWRPLSGFSQLMPPVVPSLEKSSASYLWDSAP